MRAGSVATLAAILVLAGRSDERKIGVHFITGGSAVAVGLRRTVACASVLGMIAGGPAMAQAAAVVPLQGQTPEQITADQQQCAAQATSQTGYNPAAASQAAAPAPRVGQRAAGAVRGAATGKVVSNVTKNSSTDDAMEGGAKLGAMAGGSQQRRANRGQRQEQATEQQNASAYNSSLSACLQGRGYTVQ
jgi:hypothetical protein